MATIDYKCDTCKRDITLTENALGLTVFAKCIITEGCKGKLYKTSRNENITRQVSDFPPAVSGLNDYVQRRAFHQSLINITSNPWKIEHNLGTSPAVTVYVFDGDDNPIELAPDQYTISIVDKNNIEIAFASPQRGITHSVARSSVPLEVNTVTATGELFQVSSGGLMDFASVSVINTPTGRKFLTEDDFDLQIELQIPSSAVTIFAGTNNILKDTLPNTSPWFGWEQVLVRKRRNFATKNMEILEAFQESFSDSVIDTLSDIPDGSSFEIQQIRYKNVGAGYLGEYQLIEPRSLLLLLANSPYGVVDKIRNQVIDVGELGLAANGRFFIFGGEVFIDNTNLERIYPRLEQASSDNLQNTVTPTVTPTQVPFTPTPTISITPTGTPAGTPAVTPTITPTISITPSPSPYVPPGTPDPAAPQFLKDYSAAIWLEHNGMVRDGTNNENLTTWNNLYNDGFTTQYDLTNIVDETDAYVLDGKHLRFLEEPTKTGYYQEPNGGLYIPRGSFELIFAIKKDRADTSLTGTVVIDWQNNAGNLGMLIIDNGTQTTLGFYPVGGTPGVVVVSTSSVHPDARDAVIAMRISRNTANGDVTFYHAVDPDLTDIPNITWTLNRATNTDLRTVTTHSDPYIIGHGVQLGRNWQGEVLLANWYDYGVGFNTPLMSFNPIIDFPTDYTGAVSPISSSSSSSGETYTLTSGYLPQWNPIDFPAVVSVSDVQMLPALTTQVAAVNQGWTAFVVCKSIRTVAPTGTGYELILAGGGITKYLVLDQITGEYGFRIDGAISTIGGGFSNQPVVLEWANVTGTNNFTLNAYGGVTGSTSISGLTVGDNSFDWYGMMRSGVFTEEEFDGIIMEVIFLRGGNYTAGDVSDIRNYLTAKYTGGAPVTATPTPTVTSTPGGTPGGTPAVTSTPAVTVTPASTPAVTVTPASTPAGTPAVTVTPTVTPPVVLTFNDGYILSGSTTPNAFTRIDTFPFAAPFTNATTNQNLVSGQRSGTGARSSTDMYHIGGRNPATGPGFAWNRIDRYPFASPFTSSTVGQVNPTSIPWVARVAGTGISSATTGYIAGGVEDLAGILSVVGSMLSFPFASPFGSAAVVGSLIIGKSSADGHQSPTDGFVGAGSGTAAFILEYEKFPLAAPSTNTTGIGSLVAGAYDGSERGGLSSDTDGYVVGNGAVTGTDIKRFPFAGGWSAPVQGNIGTLGVAGQRHSNDLQSGQDGFAAGSVAAVQSFPFVSPFVTSTTVGNLNPSNIFTKVGWSG